VAGAAAMVAAPPCSRKTGFDGSDRAWPGPTRSGSLVSPHAPCPLHRVGSSARPLGGTTSKSTAVLRPALHCRGANLSCSTRLRGHLTNGIGPPGDGCAFGTRRLRWAAVRLCRRGRPADLGPRHGTFEVRHPVSVKEVVASSQEVSGAPPSRWRDRDDAC
jgi:hypothetical protein